jgi:hypothetical protein
MRGDWRALLAEASSAVQPGSVRACRVESPKRRTTAAGLVPSSASPELGCDSGGEESPVEARRRGLPGGNPRRPCERSPRALQLGRRLTDDFQGRCLNGRFVGHRPICPGAARGDGDEPSRPSGLGPGARQRSGVPPLPRGERNAREAGWQQWGPLEAIPTAEMFRTVTPLEAPGSRGPSECASRRPRSRARRP